MSIYCRSVHGDHGFCHCVMSVAGSIPRQPLDGDWTRIGGGDITRFVRAVFNVTEGEGRLTLGRLAADGGLTSTMFRDSHAIYISLRGAEAALSRTAVIVQSDTPLEAFNLLSEESGSHYDIWTAQGWMSTSGADSTELQAMRQLLVAVNGRYHYRLLINGPGNRALVLSANQPFAAVLHKAEVLTRKETMQVAADSPGLHIIMMRSMTDQTFPDGAILRVAATDGPRFDQETFTEGRFVKRTGRSVRGVFLNRPAASTYELEVVAIKGIGFHLLFQNAAKAEVLPTMQKALRTIYQTGQADCCDDADGADSLQCYLCLVACAAVAFTTFLIATAAIVGAVAITGGTIIASTGVLTLVIGRILLIALVALGSNAFLTGICYMLGSCEGSPDIRRIVAAGRGNNQRYDQLCYLTSHNAFSYRSLVTPLSAQQGHSIRRQLESGVDALMLDIWRYASPDDAYLCHEPCASWKRFIVGRFDGQPMKLADELAEVVAVLTNEPERIITLIFESRLGGATPSALVNKAFSDAGATSYLFYADRENVRGANRWNVATQGWPTRRWMIDNGFRLVVFSDGAALHPTCQVRDQDGLPYVWRYAAETVYGNDSMDLTQPAKARECSMRLDERLPALPGGERRWPLLIVNYFPTFAAGSFNQSAFHLHNSYDRLSAKTKQVTQAAGRPPNFLAIDYFELGADDGPGRVWTEANTAWAAQWTAPTQMDEAEAPT